MQNSVFTGDGLSETGRMSKTANKAEKSAKKASASGAGLSIPSRSLLAERLRAMSGLRVLVLGDVGIDRYTIGAVERISPEAPVPIVRVEDEKLKLGLAANVADNLRALKSIPLLCGVVGKDRAGSTRV